MSENKTLRNRRNRPRPVAVAIGCALAGLLCGGAVTEAAELHSYCDDAVVTAFPVLGGLHNEYRVAA